MIFSGNIPAEIYVSRALTIFLSKFFKILMKYNGMDINMGKTSVETSGKFSSQ